MMPARPKPIFDGESQRLRDESVRLGRTRATGREVARREVFDP